MNRAEKKAQLKRHPKCYVCEGLGLSHAGFTGYELSEINFDHWKPKGLVGGDQRDLLANQWPVHAHPEGKCYQDQDFSTALLRNCHKGKGNKYTSGAEWVEAVKIWQRALKVRYADDLFPKRSKRDPSQGVDVSWNDDVATFAGDEYPVNIQTVKPGPNAVRWRSFAALVQPKLLWMDDEVQSRAADPRRVANLAVHLRRFPLLTPVLCRVDRGVLKVFDGNHRLCAFILARPNDPVPIIVFEGPHAKLFLEVVATAHDDLTQQKYQYTEKALKYGALNEDELEEAQRKYGAEASEKLAYQGKTSREVKLRLVGRLTESLEAAGDWRRRWIALGLTDKSWNDFIEMYAKLEPEAEPFQSDEYLRESELENLKYLCRVFDEELMQALDQVPQANASLKTKWWKEAHKRLVTRASQLIRDSLKLENTPKHPAYTPVWDQHIKQRIRGAVKKWTNSPVWRKKTTANNEPDVAAHLTQHGFTETYLIG